MSTSSCSSDSSNHDVVNQNKILDNEWESQVDEESEQLNNLISQRINQRIQSNTQLTRTPRRQRRYIERNREDGHQQLLNDYFHNSIYSEELFRRRFRMRKHVFMRIVNALSDSDDYFKQRAGGNRRLGFSALQKCTAAIRILAYGSSADSVDEYLHMSETVVRDSLRHFARGVISNFGTQYLRRPTADDLARLLHIGQARGFLGMLGSIDCMHWEWKNCPTQWSGQYAGRSSKATIILEVVASYDLWIWHAFFSTPGSHNDINVLQRSPVFDDILEESGPPVCFMVNGKEYNLGYYLADGIYPGWATFVKIITAPQIQKHKLFAARQESCRKDVERAFGVLQSRFAFIKRPCLLLNKDIMGEVLIACIIMHNMIVEDERETYLHYENIIREFKEDHPTSANDNPFEYQRRRRSAQDRFVQNYDNIRDNPTHVALKNDLIEHIWMNFRD